MLALSIVEQLMGQFRGTPFGPDLRQIVDKLNGMLPEGVSVHLDAIGDCLTVMPAVQTVYDPGIFNPVMRAATGRRRLKMVYWTASRNVTIKRLFDPFELNFMENSWFSIGFCHNARKIKTFAIQRVRSVTETGETLDRHADFNASEHMKGSFVAMRVDGDYDVVLRFGQPTAGWFRERTWHVSQVFVEDGKISASAFYRMKK